MFDRWRILSGGLLSIFRSSNHLPKSSVVLSSILCSSGLPYWTAFYVPRYQVSNDLWGKSHFNWQVEGENYHILRTGAFPFIKFHCSNRPVEDLQIEDIFYRALKILNLGLPTFAYGLAGLVMTGHMEIFQVENKEITLFYWYKEDRGSPN
ncbi:uncharacterized protein C15orf61 homolog [Eurytemora carolleeae]|uniref:uncharacterized protein C15orf61 homolog n=1 Tax=Eurytemora carolleeae TaxID=1294199 RepID=UPI000C759068|nr:uncharacterized protein C15orf61 homolog [Eurytemora carolleeae]|eukprot:XP_023339934.1 uncharacterized protein C15orf61 homolog [Eurytemora affinis]